MKELTLRSSWMLFSQLLQYPDAQWHETADEMYVDWCHLIQEEEPVSVKTLQELTGQCLADFAGMDSETITAAYVKTFDFNKKANLYLTYAQLKEDRERGPALLKLKQVYEEEDIMLDTDELPDYLPLVLEYVAIASEERGIGLLISFRKAIVVIQEELHQMQSPYRHVLDAMLFIIDQSEMTEGTFDLNSIVRTGDTSPALGCGPMWAAAGYGNVGGKS